MRRQLLLSTNEINERKSRLCTDLQKLNRLVCSHLNHFFKLTKLCQSTRLCLTFRVNSGYKFSLLVRINKIQMQDSIYHTKPSLVMAMLLSFNFKISLTIFQRILCIIHRNVLNNFSLCTLTTFSFFLKFLISISSISEAI